VHGLCAQLAGERDEHSLGCAAADYQAAAAFAQRLIEILEGFEQELRPRPGAVAPV